MLAEPALGAISQPRMVAATAAWEAPDHTPGRLLHSSVIKRVLESCRGRSRSLRLTGFQSNTLEAFPLQEPPAYGSRPSSGGTSFLMGPAFRLPPDPAMPLLFSVSFQPR